MHAYDFTGDGWADVLTTSHAGGGKDGGVLYVNPKGDSRRWEKHQVVPMIQTEATLLRDVDGDGKPELVYGAEGYVRYAKPDPANPTGTWIIHTVSEKGPWGAHGIGVGDVNGDGRMDILNGYGWWEQPAGGDNGKPWTYHPEAFRTLGQNLARRCRNGCLRCERRWPQRRRDYLTGPRLGPVLVRSKRSRRTARSRLSSTLSWTTHNSKNAGGVAFSEPHGSAIADVDGDGIPDFIVGKRYWSHLDDAYDPDPYGPPVLYWYRTVRNRKAPGGAELVPELIHNRSGVGSDVLAKDLNGDGVVDIVTSTRMGTFIFWGKPNGSKGKLTTTNRGASVAAR